MAGFVLIQIIELFQPAFSSKLLARNSPHLLNHKALKGTEISNKPSTVQPVYTDANNTYMFISHFHHVLYIESVQFHHWFHHSLQHEASWNLKGWSCGITIRNVQTTLASHIWAENRSASASKAWRKALWSSQWLGKPPGWSFVFHGCHARICKVSSGPTWRNPRTVAPSPNVNGGLCE